MNASGSSSRLWRRSLALAASMFLSAAAAEVFARACLPPPQVQASQILDPELGFTSLPCGPVELRDERGASFCGLN